jgi:hypothetical protein
MTNLPLYYKGPAPLEFMHLHWRESWSIKVEFESSPVQRGASPL